MSTTIWKKIQAFVGVPADGIPGPVTANAIADRLGLGVPQATPKPETSEFDERSDRQQDVADELRDRCQPRLFPRAVE